MKVKTVPSSKVAANPNLSLSPKDYLKDEPAKVRLLVATTEGQGKRKNDFFHATEGEFVIFPGLECDGEEVDGSCGCRRSMSGLKSLKATTTFKVEEFEPEMAVKLREDLRDHFVGSWNFVRTEATKMATSEVREIIRLAKIFPVGMILERRGDKVEERDMK